MSDQERLLRSLKKELRSLLIAAKAGLTLGELEKEYRSMIGEQLPFRALGYQSAMELVMDMPDVVQMCYRRDGIVLLKAVADESTEGIASLVARQKDKSRPRLPRLKPKITLKSAFCPDWSQQSQTPRSLPRRGRIPPTLPAIVKSQLKELLRSSSVLLSDFNKAFAHHFGRNFDFVHYGFFSMSEVINAASDIITVVQTRAGSLLTLKNSPSTSLGKELQKLPQPKLGIQSNTVKQILPPVRSASTVGTHSPTPSQPTLPPVRSTPTMDTRCPAPSFPTQNQNQIPSQQSNTSAVQLKPNEAVVAESIKMKQLQQQMKTVLVQRGVGGTVSTELKEKIRTIAAQHPEGLLVYRLPSEFEAHFKEPFPLRELGFLTVMELVAALSDVLHIESKEGEQDWRIFDINSSCSVANKTLDDDETNKEISLSGSLAHAEASDKYELSCWDFPPEPSKDPEPKLNVVTKIVKPQLGLEELHIMEEIMQEEIPPDAVQDKHLCRLPQLKSASLVGLSVEYVVSPSQFYVQLYGADTSEKLEDMMIEMRRCYASKNVADRYVMPEASVKPGHICCVRNFQDKWWYRGIIHRILSDQEVEVFYLDFGNMGIVPKSHLWFLKDCYANLPAQGIPCCLSQMKPAKGEWTSDAILEFQRLCGGKLLVGVVDEYVDDVLHLFLCDTSSDDDLYFHDVLRLEGHAVFCIENIPSKGFKELNPSALYLKPSPEPNTDLKKADASLFLEGPPGTASSEPCRNKAHFQRCDKKREDPACLKPEQGALGHGCLDVSAQSCDCRARNPCKDSPENPRLMKKEPTSQTKDTERPCSVAEMPYLEPVTVCPETWDEAAWIPLLFGGEQQVRTCSNLCSDVAVHSGQACISKERNETQHHQELEQQVGKREEREMSYWPQTTDSLGSAADCLSQAVEEFYISIVQPQESTEPSQIPRDANKLFACNTQPLPELSAFPGDKCSGDPPSEKKENNASRTQLVAFSTPRPCCAHREINHNNALVFTAELQGSPAFFIPYSPSAALGASARLVKSGGYFSLNPRKLNL